MHSASPGFIDKSTHYQLFSTFSETVTLFTHTYGIMDTNNDCLISQLLLKLIFLRKCAIYRIRKRTPWSYKVCYVTRSKRAADDSDWSYGRGVGLVNAQLQDASSVVFVRCNSSVVESECQVSTAEHFQDRYRYCAVSKLSNKNNNSSNL